MVEKVWLAKPQQEGRRNVPRRRTYTRDSKGRFATTGRKTYVKGRKGKVAGGKLTGTPVSKRSLPIAEIHPGGRKASRALQQQLMREGHSEDSFAVRSFNTLGGGFTQDRRGNGTSNFVLRDPKTRKVIATGMTFDQSAAARGYPRSVSVHDLFKTGGRKANKGAGAALMTAMARHAQGRDIKGNAKTEFKVSGAVPGAKKFYGSQGGSLTKGSSLVDWTTSGRNRLARKRRVRIVRMPSGKRVR